MPVFLPKPGAGAQACYREKELERGEKLSEMIPSFPGDLA